MGVEEVRGHLGTVLVWVEVVWDLGLVTDLTLHILEASQEVMEIEVIKEVVGMIEDILVQEEMEIEVSKVEAMEIEVTREVATMIEVSMEEEIMTEDFMEAMVTEATLATMIEVIKATMTEAIKDKTYPTEAAVYWVPRLL